MMKFLQRLLIGLACAALPLYAIADYTATQGAGTTVFAFLCQSTKVCPAHALINSSGTEIMTGPSPGFVQLTNSSITGTVSVSPTSVVPVSGVGTFTISSANNINANIVGTVNVSQANVPGVKGVGTFTVSQANVVPVSGVGTFNVSPTNTVTVTCANCGAASISNVTVVNTTATPVNTLDANTASILSAVQSAIPAGSNTIGQVTVLNTIRTLSATNTGGWTTLTMTNLLTTVNSIKASAGQLGKLYCYNPNSSVAYIQVFNVASGSVTLGTTKPSQTYGIPGTNAAGFASTVGDQYSTAISAAATTTATGLTPPSTGVDCSVSFN